MTNDAEARYSSEGIQHDLVGVVGDHELPFGTVLLTDRGAGETEVFEAVAGGE
jgi:hypothetical protein